MQLSKAVVLARFTIIFFLWVLTAILLMTAPANAEGGYCGNAAVQLQNSKLEILSCFAKFYGELLKASGHTLTVHVKTDGETEEASADSNGKEMSITVSAAFLRSPRLSDDGLRFTLCHELGHLLGGAPRRNVPFEWDGPTAPDGLSFMSSEGQSDYYAGRECMRKFLKNQKQQKGRPQKTYFSKRLTRMCTEAWQNDAADIAICERTGEGAYNMLQLTKDFDISFETPSTEAVKATILDEYPARQCRLDTALAGALCRQQNPLIFDFNDANVNECPEPTGTRPPCWYKNP